jgi:hypothetical protein
MENAKYHNHKLQPIISCKVAFAGGQYTHNDLDINGLDIDGLIDDGFIMMASPSRKWLPRLMNDGLHFF